MKFISIFLDRPRILFLTLAFILLTGISSILTVPVQENPELAERWGDITAVLPGASPERIETQISDILETELREIDEIKILSSNSSTGVGLVGIELKETVSKSQTDEVWSKIENKLRETSNLVPEGTRIGLNHSGPPTTLLFALQWLGDGEPQMIILSRLASQLKRKLANISNSEKSIIYGDTKEEIYIGADLDLLADAGMNIQDIANAVNQYDSKQAVGNITGAKSEFRIQAQDNISLVNDLKKLPLKIIGDFQALRLEDVATVNKLPVDPPIEFVEFNGIPSVFVEVRGIFSQRTDLYSGSVLRIIDEFKRELPEEIGLEF